MEKKIERKREKKEREDVRCSLRVFTAPGESDKNSIFSSLNLAAYLAVTRLTPALEIP